jgi:hypothetical protein
MDWNEMKAKLSDVYQEEGVFSSFLADAKYLSDAFKFTENLWMEQYSKIQKVNLVMLSETPLFGKNQVYFYNPESKNTAFFHFKDLQALSKKPIETSFKSGSDQRNYLLSRLAEKGFVVLDIFPFALNKPDTCLTYQNMSKSLYKKLMDVSVDIYLRPKLELMQCKSHSKTRFIYRYKRLKNITGKVVEQQLKDIGFLSDGEIVPSINGTNMSLDRDVLASF